MASPKRQGFGAVKVLNRPSLMSTAEPEAAEPIEPLTSEAPPDAVSNENDSVEPPAPMAALRPAAQPQARPAGRGIRGNQENRRPVRKEKRAITFWVNQAAQTQFKMLAVKEDRPGQDLMEEALNDLFEKYKLHRIASSNSKG